MRQEELQWKPLYGDWDSFSDAIKKIITYTNKWWIKAGYREKKHHECRCGHTAHKERLGGLMIWKMMWIICFGPLSHKISIKLKTYVKTLRTDKISPPTIVKTLKDWLGTYPLRSSLQGEFAVLVRFLLKSSCFWLCNIHFHTCHHLWKKLSFSAGDKSLSYGKKWFHLILVIILNMFVKIGSSYPNLLNSWYYSVWATCWNNVLRTKLSLA